MYLNYSNPVEYAKEILRLEKVRLPIFMKYPDLFRSLVENPLPSALSYMKGTEGNDSLHNIQTQKRNVDYSLRKFEVNEATMEVYQCGCCY